MVNYELILLYNIGFRPSEVIKFFGYKHGSAYRFWNIYRNARTYLKNDIRHRISVTSAEQKKENTLDDLTR